MWQAPAEGGIPRYMAIFQDTIPTLVGPIRSSRVYYIAWAAEWRAVYFHAGGSPQALALLRAKGRGQYVYNAEAFRYEGGAVYRLPTRSSPHNLYAAGKSLRSVGKKLGGKDKAYKTVWQFAPDAPLETRPYGGTITVGYPYNKITYKYDRKSNTYLRSVTGETKQTDAADKTRIAPKNVIVMRMRFGPLNDGHPGAPRSRGDRRRQRDGLDLDQWPDDQGHLEEDLDDQADQVLRQGRQRGDPDRRPDLRAGADDRDRELHAVDQGRLGHGSGDGLAEPELSGPAADRRVDLAGLAGHVRPRA